MRLYYQHANGQYSNLGYYDAIPDWEPETDGEWVEGEPESQVWQPVSLLEAARAAVNALPPTMRGKFVVHISAIGYALQNAVSEADVQAALIAVASIPVTEPDEIAALNQVKQALGLEG